MPTTPPPFPSAPQPQATPPPITAPSAPDGKFSISDLLAKIEELLNRLPKFPWDLSGFVKWIPWVQLIILLIFLPIILAAIGISFLVLPFATAAAPQIGFQAILGNIFLVALVVTDIIALPGLFKRKLSGWKFAMIATLISAVYDIYPQFDIISLLLTVAYLRLLVQVKPYYS